MLGRLVGSHAEVNALIEGVRACGAQVLKEPQDGPLGRYHAIFFWQASIISSLSEVVVPETP